MDGQCIQVQNLTRSSSGQRVVDALSSAVKKDKAFALMSHNGAGKST